MQISSVTRRVISAFVRLSRHLRDRGAALAIVLLVLVSGAGLLLRAESPQAVGTWRSMGAVADARTGAAAVTLADGRTLIAGGTAADGLPTDSVVIYDALANSFSPAGHLISARAGHTATLLADGRVLVTGGMTGGVISADIELFDPSSGSSSLVALMAQPRTGHAAARLADGTVLIAGGSTIDGAVLQSAELFDPAAGTVAALGSGLQQARTRASATTLIDGRVLVAGGSDGTTDLGTAEIFDPSSQSFTIVATQLSAARSGHTAILLPHNASVLIAGGTAAGAAVATADLFLPTGQFAATGSMITARSGAVGGPAGDDGYAFVAGGGSADAEAYRFATVKTDKDDYAPGTTVVITGRGFAAGENVTLTIEEVPHLDDHGPFTTLANENGEIYFDGFAVDDLDANLRFFLTATGERSDVMAGTTFTDAININSFALDCATPNDSFTSGTTVCAKATGLGSGASGKIEWWAPGAVAATRTTNYGPLNGQATDSFAPTVCGTWTLKVYQPIATFQDDDTFAVTGCDTTAPVAGTVNDGLAADIDFQTSTTTITANWTGFSDPESGITGYEWAIGTTSGGTDVQAFTSVGTATSATNATLTLSNGTKYYVTVRATNGAGLTNTATSDGVTVDTTPPVVTLASPANGSTTNDTTPTFSGVGGLVTGDLATITVKVYNGPNTLGTLARTLSATRDGTGNYSVDASPALALGQYTAQAQQSDAAGNTGFSSANTFEVHAVTSLLYNGTQIVSMPNSVTPAAVLSSTASACVSGQTVTFTLDRDPTGITPGAYPMGSATTNGSGQATAPTISTSGWLEDVYTITASFAGTSSCDSSSDEATLTVASPGDSANGGGWYTLTGSGRSNFGFTVRTVPNSSPVAYKGQFVMINNGKWRLKGTLNSYLKTSTSGAASGVGTLYYWDAAANGGLGAWAVSQLGVTYTISLVDSGQGGKNSGDKFGIHIDHVVVSPPEPANLPNSAPQALKGGDITLK